MKTGYIKSFDDTEIYTYLWDDVVKPKGIVQIFHGMAEHSGRYDEFAKMLNKEGYIVFADDHRAHGKTVKDGKLGVYQKNNCFLDTFEDEIFFSKKLKSKYKLPLYIFGQSYGSFLAQYYMTQTNIYDKMILSGSALMGWSWFVSLGRFCVKLLCSKNPNKPALFLQKASSKHYNKAVKVGSWLNSDENEVKKYYDDPLNGFTLSNKFYQDYFKALKLIYKKQNRVKVDASKPLLIISGSNDPIGHKTKSVKRLYKYFTKKLHLKSVELKIYEGARHELLNEPKCKKVVYNDIIKFLNVGF